MADPYCHLQYSEKKMNAVAKHCRAVVGEVQPSNASPFVRAEPCTISDKPHLFLQYRSLRSKERQDNLKLFLGTKIYLNTLFSQGYSKGSPKCGYQTHFKWSGKWKVFFSQLNWKIQVRLCKYQRLPEKT